MNDSGQNTDRWQRSDSQGTPQRLPQRLGHDPRAQVGPAPRQTPQQWAPTETPAASRAAWGESFYQNPQAQPVSMRDVFRRLHRSKGLGLLACLAIWAAAIAFVTLVAPRYEAETILLVDTVAMEQTASRYSSAEDVVSVFGLSKVANQAAVLRTVPAIAETTAVQLLRHLTPEHAALLPYTAVPELAEWLREDAVLITAEVGEDEADLIQITATAGGPDLSAAVSSRYAESYMSLLRSAVVRQRDAALESQRARVAEVGSELTALDEQLREFVQTTGSISIEADAQRAAARISDLQTSLDEARIAFSTHSATLESLEAEFAGLDLERLADRVASSVESEIAATQTSLTSAELNLEQYYSKYPELRADASSSPQVQKLVDDVAAMRRRLDALSDQYVREVMDSGGLDLANDAEGRAYVLRLRQQIAQERVATRAAEARVQAITSRLSAFERSRERFSDQSVSLTQLQRNRELTGERLKDEIDRLGQLQVDEPTEFVKQIQAAIVPDTPAFPNVKLILAIGFVLGILLGGGVAYGWSSIDSSVHGDEDLTHLGVPVRGRLPDLKSMVRKTIGRSETVDLGPRVVSSKLVVVHAPQAAESALFRKYALGLAARTPRGGTMLFSSADVGAGKTTVTANVAAALSLAGYRTLVIDADVFRHGQTAMLGLTTRSALDVYTGAFGPGGGVEQFGGMMQLLFGLTLRAQSPADSEAQAAQAAINLAGFYGQHFDYILIDTPPTSASSIAASVGPYAHARVMVVGAGRTPVDLVAMALSELQSAGATPTELAINRMDMSAPTAVRDAYQQARNYYSGASPS